MPSLDFSQAWPWLQWVLAVAAVVAFVGGAIKVIPGTWRFVTRFVTTVNSLAGLPEDLAKQDAFRTEQEKFRTATEDTLAAQDVKFTAQDKVLARVLHELLPNGGGSLRDDVVEIKKKLANDDERIDAIEKTMPRDELGRFTRKEETK